MSSGAWTKDDVISYTQRAAQDAHVLQPIIHQLDQYHYDGLVNDIEAGDDQNPAAFTAYNTNLWKMVHSENPQFLLGTTLIAKTTDLSTTWQNWQGLVAGAVDFVVIMALDHDTLYSYPTPKITTRFTLIQRLLWIRAGSNKFIAMYKSSLNWRLSGNCLRTAGYGSYMLDGPARRANIRKPQSWSMICRMGQVAG